MTAFAGRWSLEVGEPFQPGGQCSWTAPVTGPSSTGLVLKVGFRFPSGEQRDEAAGLRLWAAADGSSSEGLTWASAVVFFFWSIDRRSAVLSCGPAR
jgi:hypothetical protein